MHGLGKTEAQLTGLKREHDIKLVSTLAAGLVPHPVTPLFDSNPHPQSPKLPTHLRLLLRVSRCCPGMSEAWHDVRGFRRRGREEVGLGDEVPKHTHRLYTLSQYSATPSSLQKEANVTHESGDCWGSNSPKGSSCCIHLPVRTAEKGGHSSPSRSGGFRPTRMQAAWEPPMSWRIVR